MHPAILSKEKVFATGSRKPSLLEQGRRFGACFGSTVRAHTAGKPQAILGGPVVGYRNALFGLLNPEGRHLPHQSHRDYLNQLATWGYTASETEQIIIDSGK
ncbi:hypothetical protein ACVWZ8_005009 [Arthrobacter sp. UYCu723]